VTFPVRASVTQSREFPRLEGLLCELDGSLDVIIGKSCEAVANCIERLTCGKLTEN
jgi:hypothetical protein